MSKYSWAGGIRDGAALVELALLCPGVVRRFERRS
jgi:hypothetical protein